jgi:acetyltransferase
MFDYMAHYAENLRILYETPSLAGDESGSGPDRQLASKIIRTARQSGRTILTEYESKQLLVAYGIPTVDTRIARSPDEAAALAAQIGYPVVLKLHSETITHKTDVGGVKLSLADAAAVRQAYQDIQASVAAKAGEGHFLGVTVQPMSKLDGYELILGSSIDPQFGPVLLFGLGGQLVEVFKDRALGLPPLTTALARRIMERTRIYTALKGVRGRKPVELESLEEIMVRFSQLVAEQRWVKELDINPLLASEERLLALDARVVLYGPEATEDQLPKIAIRPYPAQYVSRWTSRTGEAYIIRPIRPEDEPLMVNFHEGLSDRTVFMRYMHPMQLIERVKHERLARICHCDYDREMTLVVEKLNKETGEAEIMGASRMSKLHGLDEARFSVLISDCCHGQGMGSELVRRLIVIARDEKLRRLTATLTADNESMKLIFQKLGFSLRPTDDGKMLVAELSLE